MAAKSQLLNLKNKRINMKTNYLFTLATAGLMFLSSCEKEQPPTLGNGPSEADVAFTYAPTAANANIIEFTAPNPNMVAKWEFGNGTNGEGTVARGTYPLKGTYTVTLTVFNAGGSRSATKEVVIANDDASLLSNPLYTLLTGGSAGKGFKTWVIDSTRAGHMGVGPNPSSALGNVPEYWAAARMDKSGTGLYSDQYKFSLDAFKFDHITKGRVYIDNEQAANFPDSYENKGDFDAPYADQTGGWSIVEGVDTVLKIDGKGFLGFFTGVREYKIVRISENELTLRYLDASNPALAWYIRLVPEDFPVDNGGGGSNDKYNLPLNFETEDTKFEVFGGSTYAISDNPKKEGINTSNRVLETTHGAETWAGAFVTLKNKIDFSQKSSISFKVWAPQTGTVRVKIENSANTSEFAERDVDVTTANTWVELSVDFAGAATVFDRIVLFPGWNTTAPDTYFIDDIGQK
jgi:PKD repeat protein